MPSPFRFFIHRHLRQLRHGHLIVQDAQGTACFGNEVAANSPTVTIVVHRQRFYRRVLAGGDLGVAESLMDGDWECDNLVGLVRLFIKNRRQTHWLTRGIATFRQWASRWIHFRRRNAHGAARYNIQAHYDLGNDFFKLFLDPTLCYSSAIFDHEADSLEAASLRKMRTLCSLVELHSEDRVLEIGTGWGGLAELIAKEYGCPVTTTTISAEQHVFSAKRFSEAGVADRIDLRFDDYRELNGSYDKLVSIEMVEAVGDDYLETFFETCSQRLNEQGQMGMQAIVMSDALHAEYLRSVDFIRAYIFPGGCLPSISRLSLAASRAGLRIVELHDYSPHYAETLRRWRLRFWENLDQIKAAGFDDRFIRMWDYYLSYCQAAFEERQVNLLQVSFAKQLSRTHRHSGKIPSASETARGDSLSVAEPSPNIREWQTSPALQREG